MPRYIQKERGDKPTNKPVSDSQSPISGSEPQKSGNEQIAGNQSSNAEKHPVKPQVISISEIPKIDVIEGIEANRIAKRANWISLAAVIVSALLFVGTLVLVVQAIKQSKAAVDSVALERQTHIADSIYKRKTDSRSKISDSIKKIREDSIFNAQKDFYTNAKKGVDAQITQLQQSEKNFERSNKAYLEAIEFTPIFDNKKELVAVRFNMSNKGSQPAKIIDAYYSGLVDVPGITDTSKIKNEKNAKINKLEKYSDYVSIYAPNAATVFFNPIIDTVRVKEMVVGVKNIYIYSESIYINLVTNKRTLYRFIAEVNIQNSAINYRFIQNDNIPLK